MSEPNFREGTNERALLRFLDSWRAEYVKRDAFIEIASDPLARSAFARQLRSVADFLDSGGRLQVPRKVGR